MNKTELVNAIAAGAAISKTDAKKALDVTIETIKNALAGNEKVTLIGFGTFEVAKRAARQGVNPATGAKIKIAAKKVVKFKAGADFSKAVAK